MKLYTIGFTKKRAKAFFNILRDHQVQRLVDIRLRPEGQLAGFAKGQDLPYFLEHLVDGCEYMHLPDLAPSDDILDRFGTDKNWEHYAAAFNELMIKRNVPKILNIEEFEQKTSCLLCSESLPDLCHRRLVAERIASYWRDVEIIHL